MKRLVFIAAVSCAVACVEAFAEGVKERKFTAPDGVNVITERTDESGAKTYTSTCVHVQEQIEEGEAGFDSLVLQAQDTLDGKTFNVVGAQIVKGEEGKYLRKSVVTNSNEGVLRSSDGKPYLVRRERSPLGREIDGIKRVLATRMEVGAAFNAHYVQITNLMERVRVLEAAESDRKARADEAKARAKERAEKRKEAKERDARKTIEDLKARSRRVEGRKRPPIGVTKEEINAKAGGAK